MEEGGDRRPPPRAAADRLRSFAPDLSDCTSSPRGTTPRKGGDAPAAAPGGAASPSPLRPRPPAAGAAVTRAAGDTNGFSRRPSAGGEAGGSGRPPAATPPLPPARPQSADAAGGAARPRPTSSRPGPPAPAPRGGASPAPGATPLGSLAAAAGSASRGPPASGPSSGTATPAAVVVGGLTRESLARLEAGAGRADARARTAAWLATAAPVKPGDVCEPAVPTPPGAGAAPAARGSKAAAAGAGGKSDGLAAWLTRFAPCLGCGGGPATAG
jgi:hypothetical protein